MFTRRFSTLSNENVVCVSPYLLSNFGISLSLHLLLFLHPSSSRHSVEAPSDIWLSSASGGSRRCRRFWQAVTGTPRGPDGDSWTAKRRSRGERDAHHKMQPASREHTRALGGAARRRQTVHAGEPCKCMRACTHTPTDKRTKKHTKTGTCVIVCCAPTGQSNSGNEDTADHRWAKAKDANAPARTPHPKRMGV